jgi:hypothetical protein
MKKFAFGLSLLILVSLIAACTPSGTPFPVDLVAADPANPASVVNAFFVARSAFNIDAAMQYINDSSVLVSFEDTYTGTAEIRDFLQTRADSNYQFEVSNSQVSGNQVTFTLKVYQNGQELNNFDGTATVQGGVITSMTLTMIE